MWSGYHDDALPELLRDSWERERLLILRSPRNEPISERVSSAIARISNSAERPVLGVFSSGTLSHKPRLILYSKRNIESSIDAIGSLFDCSRIRSVFCYPQPFHCFGLILGYLMPLLRGYRLVAPPGKYSEASHEAWLSSVDASTLTLGTPAHFHDLAERVKQGGLRPRASYSCIAGGASVSRKLWLEMRDRLRIEAPSIGYGGSEASPGVTHLKPGEEPREDGEIGRPLPGIELQLRDGIGVEFNGPNRCLAVINEDGTSAPSGPLILRDDVCARADGTLVYQGRTDLMLNRGGEKFALERMEAALFDELGRETICVAVPDARLGQELGVMTARRPFKVEDGPGDARDGIFSALERRFGRAFDRSRFLELEKLPRMAGQKLDRVRAGRLLANPALRFPLPAALFAAQIPHRDPMLWVDEVTWVSDAEGECRIRLRDGAHYLDASGLRSSSLIEWIAQSHALVCAARGAIDGTAIALPKVVFLAGIRDAKIHSRGVSLPPSLRVVVSAGRTLGPISIVAGVVLTEAGEELGRANLKLYAETSESRAEAGKTEPLESGQRPPPSDLTLI